MTCLKVSELKKKVQKQTFKVVLPIWFDSSLIALDLAFGQCSATKLYIPLQNDWIQCEFKAIVKNWTCDIAVYCKHQK